MGCRENGDLALEASSQGGRVGTSVQRREVACHRSGLQAIENYGWLPGLRSDTRSYVTTCFGCTGGRHRSVYLAERLARHCRETGWEEVAVHHRELE